MRIVWMLILLLCINSVICYGKNTPETSPVQIKRILIIDSFSTLDSWTNELKRGLKSKLNTVPNLLATFETYELAVRFKPDFQPAEADIMALQLKLKRHKYDMIVLTNNAAVNLFLDGKLEAAPGTPLLVAAYHGELPAEKAARINMTGVLTPATLSYNIQLSTKLLPLNRKVTVLVESSADTVALEEDFRKRYDDAKTKKLDVQFIRGREYTTAEMLQKISVLPSDSVLIFHSWASLKDTEPLDYFLILPRVRKQFKGLLLGRFRELIEKGASGGYMVSGFLQGKEAGQIAVDIFHKKKSPSSPFQLGYYRAVFDYPSLLKYKVDFQYLPENSLILNKPVHFLARHYEVIIGIIIVLLVILIILLLRQLLLAGTRRRLSAILKNLPLRICVVNRKGNVLYSHLPEDLPYAKLSNIYNPDEFPEPIRKLFPGWLEESFREWKQVEKDYELYGEKRHVDFIPLDTNTNPFGEPVVMWVSSDRTEIYAAHENISRLAEQFRLTLESIGDGVIATDAEERVTLMNPIACNMTGYDMEEACGKKLDDIFNIISYIDGSKVESPLKKALVTEKIVELANHTDLISKDGTARHIADSAAPIRTQDGKIIGGVLVFRDVTAEYDKRDRLRTNNVILQNAEKIGKFFYFCCDKKGVLQTLSANQQYAPFDAVEKKSLPDWLAPDDPAAFRKEWDPFVETAQTSVSLQFSVTPENQEKQYYELLAEKSVNEINGNWELCGVIRDITDSYLREKKYQNNWRLLKTIMDNLPGYIFVKDVEQNFKYILCNRKFGELSGGVPNELIGYTEQKLMRLDEESRERIRQSDRELANAGGVMDIVQPLNSTGHENLKLHIVKTITTNTDGKRYLIGTGVDVTAQEEYRQRLEDQQEQLRAAMEQAQAAARAKSYFLATVSHELRTPLNAVIGFSELLREAEVTAEEQKEYLGSIQYAGTALLNLVNDVLDLSRLEADKVNIETLPVDLRSLTKEVVGVFKLKAMEKNLSLQVEYNNLPPTLYLDNLRIRQIILNLTGNALKFTHHGSVKLAVSFEFSEEPGLGTLTLKVIDSGVGIRAEKLPHIFEPFFQDSGTRGSRVYEGSGLGLPISKRLAEKMNGELWAESEFGKGSTFSLRLKNVKYNMDELGNIPLKEETEEFNQAMRKQVQALLVDDVPMNLKVLHSMLKKMNVQCVLAASAEEALELIRKGYVFDIILSDLWMPGLSGSDFAEILKQDPVTARIPLVAVTADIQVPGDIAGKFGRLLTKPITRQSLQEVFVANNLYIG